MEYTKPACSEEEHLRILEERGLLIPDPDKAVHYLKYIGYYLRIRGQVAQCTREGAAQ